MYTCTIKIILKAKTAKFQLVFRIRTTLTCRWRVQKARVRCRRSQPPACCHLTRQCWRYCQCWASPVHTTTELDTNVLVYEPTYMSALVHELTLTRTYSYMNIIAHKGTRTWTYSNTNVLPMHTSSCIKTEPRRWQSCFFTDSQIVAVLFTVTYSSE